MKSILFILLILMLGLAGCGERNLSVAGDQRQTPDGFKYKVIEIEGRKFIAVQGCNGYYTVAGPIDK